MIARLPLTTTAVLAAGILAAGAVLTAGCTSDSKPTPNTTRGNDRLPAGALKLVAFDSCQDALSQLKQAAKAHLGPYGLPGLAERHVLFSAQGARAADAPAAGQAVDKAEAAPGAADSGFSGTNTHETGVDEPDLIKTDGRRIVTVSAGMLRVVDPMTKRVTGTLDLPTTSETFAPKVLEGADLLLDGDRALVLMPNWLVRTMPAPAVPDGSARRAVPPTMRSAIAGPTLLLVDLSGAPRLISSYTMDGTLVDARQVGATARIVLRSTPRLQFPYAQRATDAQRLAANKKIVDRATAEDWLPRYTVTSGGQTERGQVECDRISRPEQFSGASMVTLLTFDLGAPKLGTGDPVTVVADGDTVYSNGTSLYVATNRQWLAERMPQPASGRRAANPATNIYKFDTSGSGSPRYVAAGSVPGNLLNQYALSEWDDHLRIATTNAKSNDSTVYTLRQDGKRLVSTGKVGGLGKGERIYAVRFVGPTGYVVTFRQTDPLYTLDLTDPAKPAVVGELKITGYSAYLHPAGDGRLIGIGQEADSRGRVQGTQVSLFDVSDLAHPDRLAQYHVRNSNSEAEFDPHAFLYWPASRILVVPLTSYQPGITFSKDTVNGALVLRVGDTKLTELGSVAQPNGDPVRRSLVIDDTLWTLSTSGLLATRLSTLDKLAWVPLS